MDDAEKPKPELLTECAAALAKLQELCHQNGIRVGNSVKMSFQYDRDELYVVGGFVLFFPVPKSNEPKES